MAGADQDGIDGVTCWAGEPVAFEKAVVFRVADNGFDGGASPQLPSDGELAAVSARVGDGDGRLDPNS